jgi:hypothetical protein
LNVSERFEERATTRTYVFILEGARNEHPTLRHADRPIGVLMAVEIRVFLAMDAFSQKSGMVLAFTWMLSLSPAEQALDSKCEAFGIGCSGVRSMPWITIVDAAKRVS